LSLVEALPPPTLTPSHQCSRCFLDSRIHKPSCRNWNVFCCNSVGPQVTWNSFWSNV
jgi:hypothetical protein